MKIAKQSSKSINFFRFFPRFAYKFHPVIRLALCWSQSESYKRRAHVFCWRSIPPERKIRKPVVICTHRVLRIITNVLSDRYHLIFFGLHFSPEIDAHAEIGFGNSICPTGARPKSHLPTARRIFIMCVCVRARV